MQPDEKPRLRIGVPKGSLQSATVTLFSRAGIEMYGSDRSLKLASSDPEIEPILLRPQEIPEYVADGTLDCGLAGYDWIKERLEARSNPQGMRRIRLLADLRYAKQSLRPVRWVLAIPASNTEINSIEDLKAHLYENYASALDDPSAPKYRISAELEHYTRNWLTRDPHEIDRRLLRVEFSHGATEAKPPVFADAIVDVTETGLSLQANGLKIIATVLASTTRFFANAESYAEDWKREKMDSIALLLSAALNGEDKVILRARVPRAGGPDVSELLPGVVDHSRWPNSDGEDMVEIILPKSLAREKIPLLARHGARVISLSPIDMLYTPQPETPA